MELPQDVMNHIKTFLPPHPLQDQIRHWEIDNLLSKYKKNFYRWYFFRMEKKKEKITRFISDNDFWIKVSGLSNEKAVKLKHEYFLDKKRIKEKLKQMNINIHHCRIISTKNNKNKHGNMSEVYFNDQEIIY
jgi:hypothetical protein